jgi:hypothetical protein
MTPRDGTTVPKVCFSAKLGEEPEVEVALVRTPGWIDALASVRNCKTPSV